MKMPYGILLVLLIILSGCATIPQSTKCLQSEPRIGKMERRIYKLEKEQDRIKKVVANSKKEDRQISAAQSIIRIKDDIVNNPSSKQVQTALKNAGFYSGQIDGKIGAKTRNAVMEFQKSNNLKVDGILGKNTWEMLRAFYILEEDQAERVQEER